MQLLCVSADEDLIASSGGSLQGEGARAQESPHSRRVAFSPNFQSRAPMCFGFHTKRRF